MKRVLWVLALSALVVLTVYLYVGDDSPPIRNNVQQDHVQPIASDRGGDGLPKDDGASNDSGQKTKRMNRVQSNVGVFRKSSPASTLTDSFHQELNTLDIETLGAMALDSAMDEADRRTVWEAFLARVGDMEDKSVAYNSLVSIKDNVEGEDQQAVMKLLGTMDNEGGNAAIVDTFRSSFFDADESELARMLSYLSPQSALSDEDCEQLIALYDHVRGDELGMAIINAVGVKGGDANAQWIVTQAESADSKAEEFMMLSALSQSNSHEALVYLNERLNELARDSDATEDRLKQLRQMILNLKKQLAQES